MSGALKSDAALPDRLFGVGIERRHDIAVQRLHDTDAGKQGVAAAAAQRQRNDRLFGQRIRQLRNVIGRVPHHQRRPAIGQDEVP